MYLLERRASMIDLNSNENVLFDLRNAPPNVSSKIEPPNISVDVVSQPDNSFVEPNYQYYKSPAEIEKDNIQMAASVGGKLTIMTFVSIFVVAIVVMVVGFIAGIMRDTPSAETLYLGFTPMGYYCYDALALSIPLFFSSMIMMSSSKKKFKMKTEDFVPFDYVNPKKLLTIVICGMSVCMIAQYLGTLMSISYSLIGFDIDEATELHFGPTKFDFFMNAFCIAVLPAFFEELAYRGVVLGVLKKFDNTLAIFGSSYLFAMLHGNISQIPFAFTLGVMFAFLRIKTNSMLPGMILHFGNNFISVIIMHLSENVSYDSSSYFESAFVILTIALAIVCFYKISKSDKEFFKINVGNSRLTFGEKIKVFFSSASIIISTLILIIETITMLSFV